MHTLIEIKHALKMLILLGGTLRVVILFFNMKTELGSGGDTFPYKKRIRNTIIFVLITQVLFEIEEIVRTYYK